MKNFIHTFLILFSFFCFGQKDMNWYAFYNSDSTKIGYKDAEGKVKIEPYKLGDQTACAFCPYRSICQFDRQLPGNNYRNLPSLKDNEAILKIRAEQEVDAR